MGLLFLLLFAALPCDSRYTITLVEDGSDMLMFGSGSLDLTGLIMTGVGAFSNAITPSSAGIQAPFISLTRAGASSDMYRGLPPLPDLGPGTSLTFTGGGTGAGFGYQLTGAFTIIPSLRVPRNYVSGTFSPLTSVTFPNASFASVGVTPGTYETTLPSGDVFAVQVGLLIAGTE